MRKLLFESVFRRPLTAADVEQGGSPIGVPIPDLSLHILDAYGRPSPIGRQDPDRRQPQADLCTHVDPPDAIANDRPAEARDSCWNSRFGSEARSRFRRATQVSPGTTPAPDTLPAPSLR